ncbi:MAG: GrpB family protein, partial [bacterium]|nr:GrpB family protein [bacterium]
MKIHDYHDGWPDEFGTIAADLREVLGDVALRIDHIGSTSVPGLGAKDVIDVQVTVAELDEAALRDPVEAAGYVWLDGYKDHQPPGMELEPSELEKFMVKERPGERRANIHIRAAGRFNQGYPLVFRDYLRAHPRSAEAYAEVKRQLARIVDGDVYKYYDVKDPAMDIIMDAAWPWAAATGGM